MTVLRAGLLAAGIARTGLSLWLDRRQARALREESGRVPAAFADSVPLEAHAKASRYGQERLRLDAIDSAVELAVGAAMLLGVQEAIAGLVSRRVGPGMRRSLAILGAVSLVSSAAGLPVSAWRSLVLEQRHGFNRRSPALFARDTLVGAAVSTAIATPVAAGVLWSMRARRGPWWLGMWAGLSGLMLAAPTLHVRLVAPLFNRFVPLRAELAGPVEALLARAGFRSGGLFEMDASRRSSRGNAYFIGFGPTKRIVLFDTLIDAHPPEEILAVVAHELGHFHHRHVLTRSLRGIAMLFGISAGIGVLTRQDWLLPAMGHRLRDPALSLLSVMGLLSAGGPLLSLAGNALSRRHEFQADAYAARMTGAAPMVSALARLSRDNASSLTRDPLYSLVNDSHPPVPLRVARLLEPIGA